MLCGNASCLFLDHFCKHPSSVWGGQSSVARSGILGPKKNPNHPRKSETARRQEQSNLRFWGGGAWGQRGKREIVPKRFYAMTIKFRKCKLYSREIVLSLRRLLENHHLALFGWSFHRKLLPGSVLCFVVSDSMSSAQAHRLGPMSLRFVWLEVWTSRNLHISTILRIQPSSSELSSSGLEFCVVAR